jgi:hypothetical protein
MKNILFITAFSVSVCLSQFAIAQSPVALHHAGTVTMFYNASGFTDAYTAAVSGDTIYLPGGFFGAITIDKRLAIFGAGHHPDSTLHTYATQINGNVSLGPLSDSSHIEGLHITGHLAVSTAGIKTDNLKIRRNMIDGQLNLNGTKATPSMHVEISGNVIRSSVDLSNTLSVVLCNNILQSRVHYVYQGSITNNVFNSTPYYSYPYYAYNNIFDVDNSKVENNVFVHPDGAVVFLECDNTLINKNVFSHSSINFTNNMPTGNYIGVGSTNILMNWTSASYLYTDNYHLKTPATHIGMDGTQVGIYGGLRPWKEGSLPLNPHIQSKTIADKTDAAGKIQVQVKVVAQSN